MKIDLFMAVPLVGIALTIPFWLWVWFTRSAKKLRKEQAR